MDNFVATLRNLKPDQSWTPDDLKQRGRQVDNSWYFDNLLDPSTLYSEAADEESSEFSPTPEEKSPLEFNPLAMKVAEDRSFVEAKQEAIEKKNRGELGMLMAALRALGTEGPRVSRVPELSSDLEFSPYEGGPLGDTEESKEEILFYPEGGGEREPVTITTINTPDGLKTTGSKYRGFEFDPEETQRLLRYLQLYGAKPVSKHRAYASPAFPEYIEVRPLLSGSA